MSLFVVSLTSTSYVEAKAREGYHEAAYKGRDACESASKISKRQLLRYLRRLLKHGRQPSARPARQPTRDPRRLLKHVRLLRARHVKLLRDLRRPLEHGRLPRTRTVRPLTRDPRRLQEGAEMAGDARRP